MPRESGDERFMRAALREARRSLGQTSPNPAVGAVLVVSDRIVARGHHRRAGAAHAEVECLRQYGKRIPKNATMYVTLEPCSTSGRTGPCTDALIESGLRKIVVGALDPNPRHSGQGIKLLTKPGLQVRTGVLAAECSELNEAFNKWIQTGRPFVIAKCGMSLDGRLTASPSEGRWLTSPASRRHAHRLRAQVDAILVGAETIRTDDPRLTVRGVQGARQPWRVVLSRSGALPANARILKDRFANRTLVFREIGFDLLLRELGAKEITSVLIEGGGGVLGQALDQRLIDKVQVYIAPILTGGPIVAFGGTGANSTQEAPRLDRVGYERIGEDICITGYPAYDRAASE
ncbi:MAG TPA: bifunctional diaminohydroxyphosphoribosylaminopyrimidine deaminase/5-amino-6-(5-phosphoribosylamino)uracil reductase RibD [Chthoniobacterales bacterium]|nr:bifunctional diaminohydroxyphosphoribosylaminopyrimidine deaminase/5-amino-6-(5-phosphoribosylamino)uracil reductase RibD [Chthoniobacterales bacterium]